MTFSLFHIDAALSARIRAAVCVLGLAFSFSSLQLMMSGQTSPRPLTVAVLDFGDTRLGRLASDKVAINLKHDNSVTVLDREQARSAARGAGYAGSLNMSLNEARDLGAALGCDFFILGDAQTLRRSPSTGPVYFESYASIFLVSSRTGRLVHWERPNFQSATPGEAEESQLSALLTGETRQRYLLAIRRAHDEERGERELIPLDQQAPIIEEAPDDDKLAEAEGLRLPRPYRRLVPAYPESAARAEAEAIVDVFVDLDAGGEVMRVAVARWAGFGLDEATIDTVRKLHFFPAMRNGVGIPIRVLLRYNFRKPPR
jgi:TonB family protein